ncbi:MAG: ATP-binding protein [Clostridiales bacterium]|nr:ATP-binding protein [Clostridiales bacterium]
MMEDLSLHVLDIAQNSLRAGAKVISIEIRRLPGKDLLEIEVEDDGCGMDRDLLSKVTDPFFTTRKTRSVGLGLPLFKMAAEMTGGSFDISSTPGKGTRVKASFGFTHIDRPPLGSMSETIVTLIQGNPDVRIRYREVTENASFEFDTQEISQILQGVPLNEPEVLQWIKDHIDQCEQELLNNEHLL